MNLTVLAEAVLVVFGLFLVGLATVAFEKRPIVTRFLTSFASSAATHHTEQVFRLLIGVSLIVHAPAMWQGGVFRIVGWMIAVTSLSLLVTPWRWHHRFGQLVIPLMLRHMRLYAVGLMAFGILLLLGVFWGKGRVAAWSTATLPAAWEEMSAGVTVVRVRIERPSLKRAAAFIEAVRNRPGPALAADAVRRHDRTGWRAFLATVEPGSSHTLDHTGEHLYDLPCEDNLDSG